MNSLGWHALEIEKDDKKAAELFERSYKRGNADAAHNLGHMYMTGRYPGLQTGDKVLKGMSITDRFEWDTLLMLLVTGGLVT